MFAQSRAHSRARRSGSPALSPAGSAVPGGPRVPGEPAGLAALVERWRSAGVITAEQAGRMLSEEFVPPPAPSRPASQLASRPASRPAAAPASPPASRPASLAAEALGYLGGVVVSAAAALLVAQHWHALCTGGRLTLLLAVTVALLGVAAGVPARATGSPRRLGAVLRLASTGAGVSFLALLGGEGLQLPDRTAALLTCAGGAAYAAVLGWWRPHPLQQAATWALLAATAGTAIARLGVSGDLPGLGVWGVGVLWVVLGWSARVRPSRLAVAGGATVALVGAITTAGADAGLGLALGTAIATVAAAVLVRDLLLLAVGTLGTLFILPRALTRWLPDSGAIPYLLLLLGMLLVTAAVWTARHPRPHPPDRAGRWDRRRTR